MQEEYIAGLRMADLGYYPGWRGPGLPVLPPPSPEHPFPALPTRLQPGGKVKDPIRRPEEPDRTSGRLLDDPLGPAHVFHRCAGRQAQVAAVLVAVDSHLVPVRDDLFQPARGPAYLLSNDEE